MWETRVQALGQDDPLEKEMAPHSSTFAWEMPWTEEPGGLQSMGLQELDMTQWLNHHHVFLNTENKEHDRYLHSHHRGLSNFNLWVCTTSVCHQHVRGRHGFLTELHLPSASSMEQRQRKRQDKMHQDQSTQASWGIPEALLGWAAEQPWNPRLCMWVPLKERRRSPLLCSYSAPCVFSGT